MGREKWAWKMAGTKAAVENEKARGTEIIFSTRIVWPGQTLDLVEWLQDHCLKLDTDATAWMNSKQPTTFF